MPDHFSKHFVLLALLSLGFFVLSDVSPVKAKSGLLLFSEQGSKKPLDQSTKGMPNIPEDLDRAKINEIVAGLSDDQVRRLLIHELEKSAAGHARKDEKTQLTGFAGIVQNTEENISLFHKRLTDLRSGAVAVPEFLPRAYADLRGKGGASSILLMFGAIAILLAGGLGAEWLFGRYAADMRKRLTTSPPAHWTVKFKRLLLCSAMDFISICVFSVATLGLFFLFFNSGSFARLVLMTYLIVVLIVRGIGLLSRLLLAPDTPALRVFPLGDGSALYFHRWVMRIVLALGVGFLLRGMLELQGVSEESVVFIRALTAAIVLCMVVYLVFNNRESVARIICRGAGDRSAGINLLRAQLSTFWHLLALPYVVLTWILWVFYLLVGRYDLVIAVLALLYSVPIFIVFDWLGQKLLSAIFGIVDKPEGVQEKCEVESRADGEPVAESSEQEAVHGVTPVGRFVPILRRCLSFSIAGIVLFWLLELWGFAVDLGEQVTGAALKILLIVSLGYVAWRLIEDAINRKLKEVQGNIEVDEDSEMGGTGGTRLGTLLQIFRKFLLVVLLVTVGLIVLSAVGIDTKPLLAGAGILGLAIGLGTQNLIKDIVSGLFFLIDDAFRIGDYVESGKAKGTVEGISIRSLKLRHTRGMVHNVPFSQLGMVTNFSRDYNIVKLDFRVPFGTDIDLVRKVVKRINKEVQADEELGSNLLGPIKFGGVLAFDDSALIMRVKFKSKPGLQFLIQRQVFRRLQELFSERGLEFATRHVMVRMPGDSTPERQDGVRDTPSTSGAPSRKVGLSAAAGAAIATTITDEEAKKKQMEAAEDSDQ